MSPIFSVYDCWLLFLFLFDIIVVFNLILWCLPNLPRAVKTGVIIVVSILLLLLLVMLADKPKLILPFIKFLFVPIVKPLLVLSLPLISTLL